MDPLKELASIGPKYLAVHPLPTKGQIARHRFRRRFVSGLKTSVLVLTGRRMRPGAALFHAKLWRKLLAWCVDLCSVLFCMLILMTFAALTFDWEIPRFYFGASEWFLLNGLTLSALVCWSWELIFDGSIGKRLFRLRIYPVDGKRPFRRSVSRWSYKCAPLLGAQACLWWIWTSEPDEILWFRPGTGNEPYFIIAIGLALLSIASILWSLAPGGRSLHDRLASTRVFRIKRVAMGQGFDPLFTVSS